MHRLSLAGFVVIRQGDGAYVTEDASRLRVGIFTSGDITHPNAPNYGRYVMYHALRFLRDADIYATLYAGPCEPWDYRPLAPWNLLNDIRASNLDGIIALSSAESAKLDLCEELGIPSVGVSNENESPEISAVSELIRLGTRVLIECGCCRPALIGWETALSEQMFREELQSVGIEPLRGWLSLGHHPCKSGAGWECFRDVWRSSKVKPDGLLITDDVFFSDVAIAIREIGLKVPEQLRVVTHGNRGIPMSYPFPVTVLENDPEEHAQALVNLLISRMDGKPAREPDAALRLVRREDGPGSSVCPDETCKVGLTRQLGK